MSKIFNSEFCNVEYIEKDNVVLLTWKKFCCFDNYRNPTMFASNLLKEHHGCPYVIDARHGFEDDKADVKWGFEVLLPDMATSGCKKCIFILNEVSDIEEEMDLWTAEFMKYFKVYKVTDYNKAIELCK